MSGMEEWAKARYSRRLYRQAMNRWGVAAGGCKPAVKELPLKGTGEGNAGPQEARLG